MITKDSIETAYSFLHQKRNVYILSIADYADSMNKELYDTIAGGRPDFLRDHKRFGEDITLAVELLEKML